MSATLRKSHHASLQGQASHYKIMVTHVSNVTEVKKKITSLQYQVMHITVRSCILVLGHTAVRSCDTIRLNTSLILNHYQIKCHCQVSGVTGRWGHCCMSDQATFLVGHYLLLCHVSLSGHVCHSQVVCHSLVICLTVRSHVTRSRGSPGRVSPRLYN